MAWASRVTPGHRNLRRIPRGFQKRKQAARQFLFFFFLECDNFRSKLLPKNGGRLTPGSLAIPLGLPEAQLPDFDCRAGDPSGEDGDGVAIRGGDPFIAAATGGLGDDFGGMPSSLGLWYNHRLRGALKSVGHGFLVYRSVVSKMSKAKRVGNASWRPPMLLLQEHLPSQPLTVQLNGMDVE